MSQSPARINDVSVAADIVAAYVSNNAVPIAQLSSLIAEVHSALQGLRGETEAEPPLRPQMPAVPIKKSIHPDYLVCLEDGRKFKSLKRHLRSRYQIESGRLPAQMEPAARLSDGRTQLCRAPLRARQGHGLGSVISR